ncbi:P-loop containing nucleoside triphosphate hydrolase protein [Coniophora puteana RWD-64-598 SS2]|uniref:P-loop containing nucleoside triphosphate hydrolase protein n=1 Tax=Coniophora puteana (strain RWD-64-598) TaxID=741705 RepID=A0A5M3MT84_CONPW|nr:P-loop containing nucleoside triphosphate hydrolase protein [Coniophora puteana RWD-64-598 SS2]EIW81865.1 P-loop containing nucleoside triphosphate hydrolase protein [Coniophora puteana RWD-64-598 SS2]
MSNEDTPSDHSREVLSSKRAQTANYSSEDTRKLLSKTCEDRTGHTPHPWQLDCAEAFFLGLDCTVIAGTGAGKTLPFAMPTMVRQDRQVTLVISPLNALEYDQARRFKEMGLSATVVNGDTYTAKLHQELENLEHQFIFTSPEMAFSPSLFNSLLTTRTFQENLAGAIVDEAHCIPDWGSTFRPAYGQVEG